MQPPLNACLRIALVPALLLLASDCPIANAGLIENAGVPVQNPNGTWTYSYQVNNLAGAFDVMAWSLELAINPDWSQTDVGAGGDVTVPSFDWLAGAGIPTTGVAAQDFYSLSPAADVQIGQILGGFSFTSQYAPGTGSYTAFGSSGESEGAADVQVPAILVPEPTVPAVGLGLGLLFLASRLRDSRDTSR